MSVSIVFNTRKQTSEVLVGSRSNATVGQRDPLYLDGLAYEDEVTITGFILAETDTSEYWTLYVEEQKAIVSLDDIVVLAEDCAEIGSSRPTAEDSTPSRGRPGESAGRGGAAAARHFEDLMDAQDTLLSLSGDIPKYVVLSASGLLTSKLSEWGPTAIESGSINQRELFYLMSIATGYLANFAAEAGLPAANQCHLQEMQALMAASQGAAPERVGCRTVAYRELIPQALRRASELSHPNVEVAIKLWATNALLLGLDSVEMDLR